MANLYQFLYVVLGFLLLIVCGWLVAYIAPRLRVNWRVLFSRLPLPMLALAASYGVYKYMALFSPSLVAVLSAAAFELTYIGLAVLDNLTREQRERATWISRGAVLVSIVYNTLAGYFHVYPRALDMMQDWRAAFVLSIIHGLPLALVAYLVSHLQLHGGGGSIFKNKPTKPVTRNPEEGIPLSDVIKMESAATSSIAPPASTRKAELDRVTTEIVKRRLAGQSFAKIGADMGFTRQNASQRYKQAKQLAPDYIEALKKAREQ